MNRKNITVESATSSGKTTGLCIGLVSMICNSDYFSRITSSPVAIIITPNCTTARKNFDLLCKIAHGTDVTVCLGCTSISVAENLSYVPKYLDILIGTTDRIRYFIENGYVQLDSLMVLAIDNTEKFGNIRALEYILEHNKVAVSLILECIILCYLVAGFLGGSTYLMSFSVKMFRRL